MIKGPNNSEMETCKRIFLNTHGKKFVNEVAYLSGKVTGIFSNEQIQNKKNDCLSKVRTRIGRGRGRGYGLWQSNRLDGGGGHGRGVQCGRGNDRYLDCPYNIDGIYPFSITTK